MLERWVKAQRVGLAAYRLNLLKPSSAASGGLADRRSVEDILLAILEEEISTGSAQYSNFTDKLPSLILKLLLSIPTGLLEDSHLYDQRASWAAALNRLLGSSAKEKTKPTLLMGVQTLAYHILHSTGRPKAILRLAKAILSQSWRRHEENEDLLQILEFALGILRSTSEDTQAKLYAMETLGDALSGAPRWVEVENVLYQQMFCWPLLMPSGVFAVSAFSLPVSIDVCFDDRAKDEDEGVEIRGKGLVVTSGWEENLRKSARVARQMWRAKHGNYGSFRKKVEGVSVIFDFAVADEIVAGFPTRFTLQDSSMEAYLCQVILSRLLGNSPSSSRVITGEIGSETHDFGDYNFVYPKRVPEKLRYVLLTRSFERLILPAPQDQATGDTYRNEVKSILSEFKNEQSTEINFVNTLSNVADSFQSGGWRQFRYVRCPDISWQVHPDGERLQKLDDKKVSDCLALLKGNKDAVLEMPEELDPLHLAGALWKINTKLRDEIPLGSRPPMISWAFIRAVPDEQDARFWDVVWKVTGAPPVGFDAFYQSPTSHIAALKLGAALSCFSPPETARSHRAPDILVIFGTKHFQESFETHKWPLQRIHTFDLILEHLRDSQVLKSVPSSLMRGFLGNTRVITFKSDQVKDHSKTDTRPGLGRIEEELLRCLSIFRFGFTQPMAKVLWTTLRYQNLQVRDLLKLFVSKGFLRYGAGEYYLPGTIRQTRKILNNESREARQHYAAAVAMAPYLSPYDIPGIPFDEAFHPHYVHEAAYHLRLAGKLLTHPKDSLRGEIQNARNRLLRFAEYPGWRTVHVMLHLKTIDKDAYELAMELLELRTGSKWAPHPVHFMTAAKATEHWWEAIIHDPTHNSRNNLAALCQQIEDFYKEAERASDHPDFSTERDRNRLTVLTNHALFLDKHSSVLSSEESRSRLAELNLRAFGMLNSGVDGSTLDGRWYESVGDSIQDTKEAVDIYQLSVRWIPDFFPSWMKLIGSACLAFGDPAVADSILSKLSYEKLNEILHYSLKSLNHDVKGTRPWLYARWQSCINLLEKRFSFDTRIQTQVALYAEVLKKWKSTFTSRQIE